MLNADNIHFDCIKGVLFSGKRTYVLRDTRYHSASQIQPACFYWACTDKNHEKNTGILSTFSKNENIVVKMANYSPIFTKRFLFWENLEKIPLIFTKFCHDFCECLVRSPIHVDSARIIRPINKSRLQEGSKNMLVDISQASFWYSLTRVKRWWKCTRRTDGHTATLVSLVCKCWIRIARV